MDLIWYPFMSYILRYICRKTQLRNSPRGTPTWPIWMLHESREWLKSKRQEEITQTHFVFPGVTQQNNDA